MDHFVESNMVVKTGKGDASEEGGKKPLEHVVAIVSDFIGQWQDAEFNGHRKGAELLSIAIASSGVIDVVVGYDGLGAGIIAEGVIKWFAIGLQNTALVFNPEIIILSGDFQTAGDYFLRRVAEEMQKVSLIRLRKDIDLRYSHLDREGAIIGGARFVLHDYFTRRIDYRPKKRAASRRDSPFVHPGTGSFASQTIQ